MKLLCSGSRLARIFCLRFALSAACVVAGAVAIVSVVAPAAVVSSARAEGDEKHPIDKWYDAQMDKSSSTHEYRDVIHKALDKWDAELNKAYQELMGQLKPAGKESLKAAQLQWIKFRDAEIEFLKNSIYAMDGTMWLQVGDDRVMRLTRDRALQLRRTIETLSNN